MNKETWKKSWSETRAHWSMMKRYGQWDGKAQFFGEWVRRFTFNVYGKSGKVLRSFTKSHVGTWNRYEVAERWATVKEYLTDGQTATISLNGISKTFHK